MGKRNKKVDISRCDLNEIYYLGPYNKAVEYGNKNIDIPGVSEILQKLEVAKASYCKELSEFVESVRKTEQEKYDEYEKCSKSYKKFFYLEIAALVFLILLAKPIFAVVEAIHIGLLTRLVWLMCECIKLYAIPVGIILTIVAGSKKSTSIKNYNQYTRPISIEISNFGDAFCKVCKTYYDCIDELYLKSLDPAHREMVLFRRDQEKHNAEMLRIEKERLRKQNEMLEIERARQDAESLRLEETRRNRRATEELLDIERERERDRLRY